MENLKNIAPLSDFDWDAFVNGTTESGANSTADEQKYDTTE